MSFKNETTFRSDISYNEMTTRQTDRKQIEKFEILIILNCLKFQQKRRPFLRSGRHVTCRNDSSHQHLLLAPLSSPSELSRSLIFRFRISKPKCQTRWWSDRTPHTNLFLNFPLKNQCKWQALAWEGEREEEGVKGLTGLSLSVLKPAKLDNTRKGLLFKPSPLVCTHLRAVWPEFE